VAPDPFAVQPLVEISLSGPPSQFLSQSCHLSIALIWLQLYGLRQRNSNYLSGLPRRGEQASTRDLSDTLHS
jgi:hypothetical protein